MSMPRSGWGPRRRKPGRLSAKLNSQNSQNVIKTRMLRSFSINYVRFWQRDRTTVNRPDAIRRCSIAAGRPPSTAYQTVQIAGRAAGLTGTNTQWVGAICPARSAGIIRDRLLAASLQTRPTDHDDTTLTDCVGPRCARRGWLRRADRHCDPGRDSGGAGAGPCAGARPVGHPGERTAAVDGGIDRLPAESAAAHLHRRRRADRRVR